VAEVDRNHAELVRRAVLWLKNTRRCRLVLAEAVSTSVSEQPDAIGWLGRGESIVVECKAHRDDWSRDHLKPSVRAGLRMGYRRYYMAPTGLAEPWTSDQSWGLLYVGTRVRVVRESELFPDANRDGEIAHLVSEFSRVLSGIRDPKRHRTGVALDSELRDSLIRWRGYLRTLQQLERPGGESG